MCVAYSPITWQENGTLQTLADVHKARDTEENIQLQQWYIWATMRKGHSVPNSVIGFKTQNKKKKNLNMLLVITWYYSETGSWWTFQWLEKAIPRGNRLIFCSLHLRQACKIPMPERNFMVNCTLKSSETEVSHPKQILPNFFGLPLEMYVSLYIDKDTFNEITSKSMSGKGIVF